MTQLELVPLTAEELKARGPMLARMTMELRELRADHTEQRAAMREAEKDLQRRIHDLAKSIRDGRPKEQP